MAQLLYLCDEQAYTDSLRQAQAYAEKHNSQFLLAWVVAYVNGTSKKGPKKKIPEELCDKFIVTLFKAHTAPNTTDIWMQPLPAPIPQQPDVPWLVHTLEAASTEPQWSPNIPRLWQMWDGYGWRGVSGVGKSWKWQEQEVTLDTQHDWRKFWRIFTPIQRMPVHTDWYFQEPHRSNIFSSIEQQYKKPDNYQYTLDTFMARVQCGPEAIGHAVLKMMTKKSRGSSSKQDADANDRMGDFEDQNFTDPLHALHA